MTINMTRSDAIQLTRNVLLSKDNGVLR